jgi:hypothetical protein
MPQYMMAPGLIAMQTLNMDKVAIVEHLDWGRLALLLSNIFRFFAST